MDFFTDPENIIRMVTQVITVLLGTCIGAFLAYRFAVRSQRKKQREENLSYLHFAIARLVALQNDFYLFKSQMVLSKVKEAQEVDQKRENAKLNKERELNLSIKEMSSKINYSHYDWPFNIERLSFITDRDPNIVALMSAGSYSVEALRDIITSTNDLIDEERQSDAPSTDDGKRIVNHCAQMRLDLLTSLTKNLGEQIDSSLYLVEKSVELLIAAGQDIFGSGMKIRSSNIKDPELQKLKPKPIESWEQRNWLPKDKDRFTTFMEKIRGQNTPHKEKSGEDT